MCTSTKSVLLSLLVFGCGGKQECPDCGNTPTIDCAPYDPSVTGIDCEVVQFCSDASFDCWYETTDGSRYDCEPGCQCSAVIEDVLCDVCAFGATTASNFGCP